uniref:non-specific serine/threonine protein kinase n=1 Tax=Leersia perrieri TaxID=77586 RepID=A0A0D9W9Z8_9ORYZ
MSNFGEGHAGKITSYGTGNRQQFPPSRHLFLRDSPFSRDLCCRRCIRHAKQWPQLHRWQYARLCWWLLHSGFFSPVSTNRRYIGIWFSESSTDAIVWVANRETPLNDTTGVLVIDETGVILLLDGSGHVAWSSNTTVPSSSAVAQLQESGNLVVRDQSSGAILRSNTQVAGMRLGRNPQTGAEWSLTSWRSPSDPATGDYRFVLENKGLPETVLWHGDDTKKYQTGPWNGLWFSGIPEMASYASMLTTHVVVEPDEIARFFNTTPGAPFSRVVLDEVGVVKRLVWDRSSKVVHGPSIVLLAPLDTSDEVSLTSFRGCSVEQSPAMDQAATANIFHQRVISVVLLSLATSAAGTAPDTLSKGRNLTDGNTLVSAGGSFTLGFFSPGLPSKRYLGIWFSESTDAIVWVANRNTPLNNTTGVLIINATGILLLVDGSGQVAWSSNTTNPSSSAEAQLIESGNLVVRDQSSGAILWQSFDHPSNTIIAGMRLGKNPQTGAEWFLTSWRAPDDPATGDFRRVLDTKGLPDSVTWRGTVKKYRTGPWNGLWFSGVPEMASYSSLFTNQVVVKPDEIARVFNSTPGAPFSRLMLDEVGVVQRLVWDASSREWNVFTRAPRDLCDDYAKCGAFGLCNVNTASTLFCSCMVGFSPASPSQWSMREASGGCRRNVPLDCGNGSTTTTDGFVAVRGVKLPDTDNATVDMGATLDDCRAWCLGNCSCVAYAAADIRGGGGGSGCVMWIGDIVDVRYVDKGQDLFLRLAKSELDNSKKRAAIKILLPVTAACLLLLTSIFLVWLCKYRGKRQNKVVQKKRMLGYMRASNELGDENLELPFVGFGDIAAATNNFSDENMLGQGGFGKVYKGMLDNNKEVAIKRLSKGSGQGVEEFRNEVALIAKLQHRNLVKLLGCCIHGDEKLLIYEYMPNKNPASKYMLDWSTRFKIIKGVARGLLYLHQDSRLTIIHRDLKSSNILLDVDMSPKISDFGMARIFGGNQQEANTNRVVGTYSGYMSPEYAMDGAFSVKSDTYSYGVILLEIISGLKITLPQLTNFPNLLAYAWSLWKDDKAMNLVDSSIVDSCSPTEVLLCIHIGLLCVQDNPNNRPLMSSVVFMLENETTTPSAPIQPVYFAHRASEAKPTGENTDSSTNDMSLTVLEGR